MNPLRHLAVCLALAAAFTTLTACETTHAPEPPETPESIAGGWSSAEVNGDIQKAAALVASQIPNENLDRVVSAEQQVVAGTNYRMVLQMTSGRRYQAVVYEHWAGEMSVTSIDALDAGR